MTDYERGLRNNLEAEVAQLRALVQHWRFSQHHAGCPCNLCERTAAELPDLPYYPEHGLSRKVSQPWPNDDPEEGPLVPPVEPLVDWTAVEAAHRELEEKGAFVPDVRPDAARERR